MTQKNLKIFKNYKADEVFIHYSDSGNFLNQKHNPQKHHEI